MSLIKLKNSQFEEFYLESSLIEKIIYGSGNTSEIFLTTGRWVNCIENPDEVKRIIDKLQEPVDSV